MAFSKFVLKWQITKMERSCSVCVCVCRMQDIITGADLTRGLGMVYLIYATFMLWVEGNACTLSYTLSRSVSSFSHMIYYPLKHNQASKPTHTSKKGNMWKKSELINTCFFLLVSTPAIKFILSFVQKRCRGKKMMKASQKATKNTRAVEYIMCLYSCLFVLCFRC